MPQVAAPHGRERLAIAVLFFVNGFAFANWATRIPHIQSAIGLGDGALGAALFALAVGSLLSMPATGGLVARVGAARVTTGGALLVCLTLAFAGSAGTFSGLLGLLALFGAAVGCMDVAMNAQAAASEGRTGRPIMASYHGAYSLGGLFGAGSGGLFTLAAIDPPTHLGIIAAGLLGVVIGACRHLRHDAVRGSGEAMLSWPRRELLVPAAIAFCVLLAEGAMADWTTLYLARDLAAGPGEAVLGFAAFSVAMATGRFLGDRVIQRLGPARVVAGGGVVAALGLAIAILAGRAGWAIAGFALVGAGLACVFPCLVSAASRARSMGAGPAIAAVATLGYLGFLLGPPLIGYLSEAVSLRGALGLVAVACLMVALLGRRVGA